MKIFGKLCLLASILLYSITSYAQTDFGGIARFDRTVCDWGDLTLKDGPQSCSFKVENIGSGDMIINSVVSSCGCTDVTWTKGRIAPGQSGTITATYSNDEGPYTFDKTLTVYIEGIRKPVLLHLRGVVHAKKVALKESYPVHFGNLGFRKSDFKVGNMSQGEVKSTEITLANIGRKSITVSFTDLSDFLTITPSSLTIEGNSTAVVVVTVQSDRSLWGTNVYTAVPVVNGAVQGGEINFIATTREGFGNIPESEKKYAPKADYESSVAPKPVKSGEKMEASFTIRNSGRKTLNIYKVEFKQSQLESLTPTGPFSIEGNKSLKLNFRVKTEDMDPDSENVCQITLYTNDPQHSIINLYIDAIVL